MYRCAACQQGFAGPLSFSMHKEFGRCLPEEELPKRNLTRMMRYTITAKHKIEKIETEYWTLISPPNVYGPRPSPRLINPYRRTADKAPTR